MTLLMLIRNALVSYMRQRRLRVIGVFAVAFLGIAVVLGTLALEESAKIVMDFSVTTMEMFGLLIVLFRGSRILQQSKQNQLLVIMDMKRVKRSDFLLSQYIALGLLVLLMYVVLTLCLVLVMRGQGIAYDPLYFRGIALSFIKIMVTRSIVLLLSTVTGPFLTMFGALVVYMVSHSFGFMKRYFGVFRPDGFGNILSSALYYIFPNFAQLSTQDQLGLQTVYAWTSGQLLLTMGIHILYAMAVLRVASLVFKRRES